MVEPSTTIPVVRESVAAILRLHPVQSQTVAKGKVLSKKFQASLSGTAFCIVADRYLLTAYHVFNSGKQRNPKDLFYAFTVPNNGNTACHFPIVSFPIERSDLDIAALEVGPCATAGVRLPAIPVSFDQRVDGERVCTVGFPAPAITEIKVDSHGNYLGGQFFLKSHGNDGIVSAQYVVDGVLLYELNVSWHHGESGGPIVALAEKPAVFSLMQHYRNIQSPHGVVAGPHCGRALSVIRTELLNLGVTTA